MVDFSKYYRSYKYMQDMLKSDFTHNYIEEALKDGDEGKDSIFGKTNEKVIDMPALYNPEILCGKTLCSPHHCTHSDVLSRADEYHLRIPDAF